MRPTDPRLVRRLAPARRPLTGVIAGGAGISLLVIGQAWLVAGLVVAVANGGAVRPWALSVVVVFAVRGLVGVGVDLAASRAAGVVGTDVRRELLTAVLSPGRAATSRVAGTGETAVLATRGVASAEPYLTRYLPALVLAGVLPLVTVVAIATQDVMSAVIVLATLPLIPVFGALVGLATRDRAAKQWREMSSLSGHFVDVMRGLPTLVAFRRAKVQTARIREVTERYRQASLATLRIAFASSAVLELVATLSVALVAVTVGVRLAQGGLDLRTALVVLLLAPEAYWPLRRVGAEFHAAAEGVATFERVDELLSDAHDSALAAAGEAPERPGDLEVDDVTVTYPGRATPALDRVSLTVPRTGITAVTGPSGCGKSTLLSVLAGLRSPDSGSLSVRERQVGGEAWRTEVALLPQRPLFVAGSIADNVRLGAPDASDDAVWRVLRRVALEERVRELEAGLDTPLGEDGGTLSAGERARLALARIVLSDRPWVLLDEPTAHLDALTEHVVADTLVELARDRAVVVVAHRPALVDLADHVVHLAAQHGTLPETAGANAGPGARRTSAAPVDALAPAASYRRSGLALPTVIGALASASGVALTATSGWLIVQAASRPAVLTLMVAIVGVRAFGLARPVLRYVERLLSHDAALGLLAQRRAEVYDALVPLTPARLGPRRGDVLSSVVDDVDSILDRELRSRMPARALVLVAALAVAVTAAIAPLAALVVAGCAAAGGVAHVVARVGAGRGERDMVAARARLSERVVELTQAADELVMWQARSRAVDRVAEASDEVAAGSTRSALWLATARALALTACGASVAGVAALVAPDVAAGRVSAPLAALIVLLPLALGEVILPAVDAGGASARATAADTRLQALLALTPAVTGPEHAEELPTDAVVDVVGVTARWDERPALSDLSLRVSPGQRVGVVGPSGSGKSTLASLLMRFVDPDQGSVGLGGVDLPRLALDDVRRTVGLVDDDPHVFATTVAENIRLARPAATDDEVDGALRDAGLDTWLDGLEAGLATRLGDGAAAVSGGERARLGVARSLLADQRVLVLDEPTAHLDHANAELLARQVLGREGDRAVVWITHESLGLDLLDFVIDLESSDPATTSP